MKLLTQESLKAIKEHIANTAAATLDTASSQIEAVREEVQNLIENLPSGEGSDTPLPAAANLIKTTYKELVELRDSNSLIPGALYRITDYQTTTTQSYTRSAFHQFDVIVLALSEDTLSEDAWATYHFDENGNPDGYFAAVSTVASTEGEGSKPIWINPDQPLVDIPIKYKLFLDPETEASMYQPDEDNPRGEANLKGSNKVIIELTYALNAAGESVPAMLQHDPATPCTVTNSLIDIKYSMSTNESLLYPKDDSEVVTDEIVQGDIWWSKQDVFIAYGYVDGIPCLYKNKLDITDDNNYGFNPEAPDLLDQFRWAGTYTLNDVVYDKWDKYEYNDSEENPTWDFVEMSYLTNQVIADGKFPFSQEDLRRAIHINPLEEEHSPALLIYDGTMSWDGKIYDKWLCHIKPVGTEEEESWKVEEYGDGYPVVYLTDKLVQIGSSVVIKRANLSAWKIKYCLDNDEERFSWALNQTAIISKGQIDKGELLLRCPAQDFDPETENPLREDYVYAWASSARFGEAHAESFKGYMVYSRTPEVEDGDIVYDDQLADVFQVETISGKGVIYFMEDEYGNQAGYDFKNIQFRRSCLSVAENSENYAEKIANLTRYSETEAQLFLHPFAFSGGLNKYGPRPSESYSEIGMIEDPIKHSVVYEFVGHDFYYNSKYFYTFSLFPIDSDSAEISDFSMNEPFLNKQTPYMQCFNNKIAPIYSITDTGIHSSSGWDENWAGSGSASWINSNQWLNDTILCQVDYDVECYMGSNIFADANKTNTFIASNSLLDNTFNAKAFKNIFLIGNFENNVFDGDFFLSNHVMSRDFSNNVDRGSQNLFCSFIEGCAANELKLSMSSIYKKIWWSTVIYDTLSTIGQGIGIDSAGTVIRNISIEPGFKYSGILEVPAYDDKNPVYYHYVPKNVEEIAGE